MVNNSDETADEAAAFMTAVDNMLNASTAPTPPRGRHFAGGGPRFGYGGQRDLWDALGYAPEHSYSDYREWYERGGIARPIVKKPAAVTAAPTTSTSRSTQTVILTVLRLVKILPTNSVVGILTDSSSSAISTRGRAENTVAVALLNGVMLSASS